MQAGAAVQSALADPEQLRETRQDLSSTILELELRLGRKMNPDTSCHPEIDYGRGVNRNTV